MWIEAWARPLAMARPSRSGPQRRQRSKGCGPATKQMRDGHRGSYRGYDGWFATPINNAKLAAVAVYSDQVAAFLRLFELCSGEYPRFYASVRQLGAVDKAHRAEALEASESCDGGGRS